MVLVKQVLKKNIKTTVKLLRLIKKQDPSSIKHFKFLYPHKDNTHKVGITRLSGSGKSTIISSLIEKYRSKEKTVVVIAIDPSSSFQEVQSWRQDQDAEIFTDTGAYIKSIPTAGWHGFISKVTSSMVNGMDAARYDVVMVETVGVDQAEVDIKRM